MFRLVTRYISNATNHFPKMLSTKYQDSSNWSIPTVDSLAWGQRKYLKPETPIPLPSTNILNSSPQQNTFIMYPTPIKLSKNKSRIESYDQWFERRLNDKTEDMFLL